MSKFKVTSGTTTYTGYDTIDKDVCKLVLVVNDAVIEAGDPTGWHIEEVAEEEQPKDVPELIPDYEAAREYLGQKEEYETFSLYDGQAEKLNAFAVLDTLCKAWNKADGFVPDWKNSNEKKWMPLMTTNNGDIQVQPDWVVHYYSPFVFKTVERAKQFGEKFIDLFRQMYGITED